MALGFSVFNIATSCISECFLAYKYGSYIKEYNNLKQLDLIKHLSDETAKNLRKSFNISTVTFVGFTLLNLVATSALNGPTFGQELPLVVDIILSSIAVLISGGVFFALGHSLINSDVINKIKHNNSQTNQNEPSAAPSIA